MDIYLDVESCGLKGRLLSIQYSLGKNQPVKIWTYADPEPKELLELLNKTDTRMIGYNIGFDVFKLYQHFQPEEPFKCQIIDLYQHFLFAKPYCYLPLRSKRGLICIKRVPNKYKEVIKNIVKNKISKVIPSVFPIKIKEHYNNEYLTTLVFCIDSSLKLKNLVKLWSKNEIITIEEAFVMPKDIGFKEDKSYPFPLEHEQQYYDELFKINKNKLNEPQTIEYMTKDIEYLWQLEDHLLSCGNPPIEEDFNDTVTHIVAYTKYKGFTYNYAKVSESYNNLKREIEEINNCFNFNINSNPQKLKWLKSIAVIPDLVVSSDIDHLKLLLETDIIEGEENKNKIKKLMSYRPKCQQLKQLEVLLKGKGRIHPDFRVVGTGTNRMAGTGGINYQGIARTGDIRKYVDCSQGGDFDGLEVVIAANFFKDEKCLDELGKGIDPHIMTAHLLFDELDNYDYDELIKIKQDKNHPDHKKIKELRQLGKRVRFALLYFCTPYLISNILDKEIQETEQILNDRFFQHYESLGRTRREFERKFCTADFETWDKRSVEQMEDHAENLLGNRKYVVLERYIASWLWKEAWNLSKEIAGGDKNKIVRTESKGPQTMQQALLSSFLGAASGIQKVIYRQLGNYPIQSSGAELTKILMSRIWKKHHTPMMNIHDEIIIPSGFEDKYNTIKHTVDEFIAEYRKLIKYLNMDWNKMKVWADK